MFDACRVLKSIPRARSVCISATTAREPASRRGEVHTRGDAAPAEAINPRELKEIARDCRSERLRDTKAICTASQQFDDKGNIHLVFPQIVLISSRMVYIEV